ncbi:MAG: metallophosphoesterase [Saprospiraceae bacterium]
MKIVQLTDLHIGLEGQETFGVDVRGNFLKALEALRAEPPDHLVVSGDLCFQTGDREVYQWIGEQLRDFPSQVWWMAGNHDDPAEMARVYGLEDSMKGTDLCYTARLGEMDWVFLDTSSYEVSEAQQGWLRSVIAGREGPLYVFMHHPPALVGVPFMDQRYPLRNWAQMQDIFLGYPDQVWVFSGHYHVEKSVHLKNLHIFVTPSTFFQIGQSSPEFQVDHYRIGWREMVWEDGLFQTTVRYIDPV